MRTNHLTRGLRRAALAAALAAVLPGAQAGVSFNVSFGDPSNQWSAYHGLIRAQVEAAGQEWMRFFGQPAFNTTLDVLVNFGPVATANGGSAAASYVDTVGGFTLWEAGATAKLRHGGDVNGSDADIVFTIGTNGYLQNELWFDPTPGDLSDDPVPANRTDARSVMLHEFGHAFGFNGWRDWASGQLPGNYQSTFDQFVTGGGASAAYFNGPQAMAVYGGRVPLTGGNLFHLGNSNASGLPGVDLVPDLMNGVVFYRGTRYQVSALDLAIMQDVGLPFVGQVPEPASALLLLGGVALLGAAVRRRSAGQSA